MPVGLAVFRPEEVPNGLKRSLGQRRFLRVGQLGGQTHLPRWAVAFVVGKRPAPASARMAATSARMVSALRRRPSTRRRPILGPSMAMVRQRRETGCRTQHQHSTKTSLNHVLVTGTEAGDGGVVGDQVGADDSIGHIGFTQRLDATVSGHLCLQ